MAKQEEGEEGTDEQMRGHKVVNLWPTTKQLDYVLTNEAMPHS